MVTPLSRERSPHRRDAPAVESVLVGVDLSDGSRRALRFALQRARINDWRVTVAHVINWSRYSTFHTYEDNEMRPVTVKAEIAQAQREIVDVLLAEADLQLKGGKRPTGAVFETLILDLASRGPA